ncbi:MAG: LysR substrate-binding domain-containing protein [Roseobacter sp.]
MTLGGAGISLNSLWLVHDDLANGALRRVLCGFDNAEKLALWLIYPKSNVVSAKVRVFMEFLIKQIGKQPIWQQSE